jgi:hypothetical protein
MNDNMYYQQNYNPNENYTNQNVYESGYQAPSVNNNYSYKPPSHFRNDSPTYDFSRAVPSHFSMNQNQVSNKLIWLDNRLANFSHYSFILWCLLILSIFSLFGSIFEFSSDPDYQEYSRNRSKSRNTYEVINFFVNIFHVGTYIYGIQAYSKQKAKMNQYLEFMVIGCFVLNFCYFFMFIFIYYTTFFSWCIDLFYLILNIVVYYQALEITKLFYEKENLRRQYDNMII